MTLNNITPVFDLTHSTITQVKLFANRASKVKITDWLVYRERDSMTRTCQINNVVTDKVNPSKYHFAFQFQFVFNRSFIINKYICMV